MEQIHSSLLQTTDKKKQVSLLYSGSNLFLKRMRASLCQQLKKHFSAQHLSESQKHALLYSFEHPGKMLRGCLCYVTATSLNIPTHQVNSLAMAVECAHAYTLIHDDLPAMDDDSFRRGQPSHHKKFPEGGSILIGDALQAETFALLSQCTQLTPDQKIYALKQFSEALSAQGLIAGQWEDLYEPPRTLCALKSLHEKKTGLLFGALLKTTGYLKGGAAQADTLSKLGNDLGFAYQIQDDLHDKSANFLTLGKLKSSDKAKGVLAFLSEKEALTLLNDTKNVIRDSLIELSCQKTLLEHVIFDKILTV